MALCEARLVADCECALCRPLAWCACVCPALGVIACRVTEPEDDDAATAAKFGTEATLLRSFGEPPQPALISACCASCACERAAREQLGQPQNLRAQRFEMATMQSTRICINQTPTKQTNYKMSHLLRSGLCLPLAFLRRLCGLLRSKATDHTHQSAKCRVKQARKRTLGVPSLPA